MNSKLYIPGEPRPWKRAASNGNRRYTDPEMAELQRSISALAKVHMRDMIPAGRPVEIEYWFHMKPPKNLDFEARPYPAKRPDLDNLEKLITDALNGIAYNDDCQIVDSHTRKVWAINTEPHTEVYVREIPF